MIHESVNIELNYEKLGLTHDDYVPTLTTYFIDNDIDTHGLRLRPTVVICSGGGYGHHSFREGEAIAIRMNSLGYHACVLRYSLKPNSFPCQVFELACAVAYLRKNSAEYNIDPERIIVAGFSAGGHVAASLGTMWNKDFISKALNIPEDMLKPDAMLLAYPVITSGEFAHRGSFTNLLGDNYDKLLEFASLENQVDEATPKTFMWHTFEDGSVPLENSLLFASALRRANVEFEYHVFPKGSHGLALCTEETNRIQNDKIQVENACWIDMFANWVELCL